MFYIAFHNDQHQIAGFVKVGRNGVNYVYQEETARSVFRDKHRAERLAEIMTDQLHRAEMSGYYRAHEI
jgi:hypothetical protein